MHRRKLNHLIWLLASVLLVFDEQPAAAHPPMGIVVDKKGNVYFSDLETVWKLDTAGKLKVFRPGVSGRHVHELSIDKDDNIYGADISYESQKWISDVWKITTDGQLTYLLEPTSNPPRGISMWLDIQGRMYLVDQDNHKKTQTLLLRRAPDGNVVTLAGGEFGILDGKGVGARFSSVGGMVFGPDDVLYLTDGTTVRTVTTDGVVTTVAKDLCNRTVEDRPMLFGKNEGILTGLSVDAQRNIFLADAGNQRLLKINRNGKAEVVYRGEYPYYPNGVAATATGDLYILEVGFTPPSKWLTPRVRKIPSVGQSTIVAAPGEQNVGELAKVQPPAEGGTSEYSSSSHSHGRGKYFSALLLVALIGIFLLAWKRKRRLRDA